MSGRTVTRIAHQKKSFLESFRQHGIITWACRESGLSRSSVYRLQEDDEQFAYDFREAEIEATETMEAEAYRRGVRGTAKPVYQGGVRVGTVQEFSDVLLIFMLKARAPEKYRETKPGQEGAAPPVKAYPDCEWERLP